MQPQRIQLGTYRGLRSGMILHPSWSPEVYLEGSIQRHDTMSREHQGPRAVLNAVERLARGYGTECERSRKDLEIARNQLHDYQARVGQLFQHEDYLRELTSLRDRLKAALAGAEPKEGEPNVADLSERLKGLRAGNAVEAAPERTAKRQVSAEVPVTTRILRPEQTTSEEWQRLVTEGEERKAALG
jgi:hypothetical protein